MAAAGDVVLVSFSSLVRSSQLQLVEIVHGLDSRGEQPAVHHLGGEPVGLAEFEPVAI
jgi:hypothetical protein